MKITVELKRRADGPIGLARYYETRIEGPREQVEYAVEWLEARTIAKSQEWTWTRTCINPRASAVHEALVGTPRAACLLQLFAGGLVDRLAQDWLLREQLLAEVISVWSWEMP